MDKKVTIIATAAIVVTSSAAFFIANKLKKSNEETPVEAGTSEDLPFNVESISVP